jgi:tetratricopeptide (TPR) repeat protein
MSNLNRIEQLLKFVDEEPSNPFNLYALALEYQNVDIKNAALYYDKLLIEHESYIPTYYHAAAFYAENRSIDRAKQIYEKGIRLSKEQNKAHALKELQNAYQNFLFEEDLD